MVNPNKAVVLGGKGLIGNELSFGLKFGSEEVDVKKYEQIDKAVNENDASCIIYLASLNLKDSEKNPKGAYEVGLKGLLNAIDVANKKSIPLVFISSGAIFSGDKGKVFSEKDTPSPLNIYGKIKYLSELMIKDLCKKYIIVRAGWLFGFNGKGNFFNRIMEKVKREEDIEVTSWQTGSPTYIKDFLNKLKNLLENEKFRIWNLINKNGNVSAEEIAIEIKSFLKSNSKIIKMGYSEDEGVKRSKSESLVSEEIEMRDWKEAMIEYLRENYEKV